MAVAKATSAQHRPGLVHRAGDRVGAWRGNRREFLERIMGRHSPRGCRNRTLRLWCGCCHKRVRRSTGQYACRRRLISFGCRGTAASRLPWPPYPHPHARRNPGPVDNEADGIRANDRRRQWPGLLARRSVAMRCDGPYPHPRIGRDPRPVNKRPHALPPSLHRPIPTPALLALGGAG